MSKYRTHTCGELREKHIGQTVKLSGWLENIRDHGGVLFLDLRDQYGITQVVVHNENFKTGRESVITVSGEVKKRDDDTVNPKIETGLVEVHSEAIEIQSQITGALPFEVRDSKNTREEVRLAHRFLDLRNPAVKDNIMLRSKVLGFLRGKMEELGFSEIQTPILTSSSPEGARDYLVPSRKHKGKFYALPQAPQIFKQLLMVSGFDRYYQIAPCFRDEDARADRTPGEFYQLDFEMAFAEQDDVLHVAETVLHDTFTAFSSKQVSPVPFRRLPYKEAMLKYGTDKPDLRNPLIIEDLTQFFSDVDFAPFQNTQVRGIVAPECAYQSRSFYEKMLEFATEIGMKGLGYIQVLEDDTLKGPIVKFLSEDKKKSLREMLKLKRNDTLFFIADTQKLVNSLAGQIRAELGSRLDIIDKSRFEFCFITDFPMYSENVETGQIEFTHNPFSMPQGGLSALCEQNPSDVLAHQYDVVCNGHELSSGAVRNHLPDVMEKAFEIAEYTKQDLQENFPALYNAFQYGAPPHAGMAHGFDRIIMLLTGEESIREVIAFPLSGNAQDLLLGAPGEVTEQQLREAHIKVR